jgi:hypothetical protein
VAALRKAVSEAVADEADLTLPKTADGDPARLRGLPAIGRSVSGAIRETDPERETVRRDEQQRRKALAPESSAP